MTIPSSLPSPPSPPCSPPRKRPRRGARKSKAERLAARAAREGAADVASVAAVDPADLAKLRSAVLEATSSVDWDRAQALAMRLGGAAPRILMVSTLVFDREAPRAAVHYARRLGLPTEELLVALGLEATATTVDEGNVGDAVGRRALLVAKFLADASVELVPNAIRLERCVLPWLIRHAQAVQSTCVAADEDEVDDHHNSRDEGKLAPKAELNPHQHAAELPTPARTTLLSAARLVLQHQQQKYPEEKRELQRQLIARLVRERRLLGLAFQYVDAWQPLLTTITTATPGDTKANDVSLLCSWDADALSREQSRRRDVAARLEALLRMLWPDARVLVFGSSTTGLLIPPAIKNQSSTDDAEGEDVDLCALLPSCPVLKAETATFVEEIRDHLNMYLPEEGEALAITGARIPIVRWRDPETKLRCDLCINNLPAILNTQLISTLLDHDPRIRMLSLWMKSWHHARSDLFGGAISSYGMELLVLYFLQRGPGILVSVPELSTIASAETLQGVDVEAARSKLSGLLGRERVPAAGKIVNTPISITQLIVDFFSFYGTNGGFDFENDVVSLREVSLSKQDRNWQRKNWRFSLSIEDPIEVERDLGTLFTRASLTRFRSAILESAITIAENLTSPAPLCDTLRLLLSYSHPK